MIYKLIWTGKKSNVVNHTDTHFNEIPKPYSEITYTEFYMQVAHYSPDYIEYRQVRIEGKKGIHNTEIYWYKESAYALVFLWEGFRYFRIGG